MLEVHQKTIWKYHGKSHYHFFETLEVGSRNPCGLLVQSLDQTAVRKKYTSILAFTKAVDSIYKSLLSLWCGQIWWSLVCGIFDREISMSLITPPKKAISSSSISPASTDEAHTSSPSSHRESSAGVRTHGYLIALLLPPKTSRLQASHTRTTI